ncbi:hypothetical protein [Chloroflexus sp.]|uniref:hypothetical protein n=1 Tax=Chloroflexus sp. TaxID=1904827 RepID=UPI002ACEB76D|nr:hypothetical protein [Chloroflexus sp.]
MHAIGTTAQLITFTGSTTQTGWRGELYVNGNGTAMIEHAVSGVDAFTFRVRSGSVASRVAQVTMTINPSGDTTRPTLLWSSPANNASGLVAGTTPVYTDTVGSVFTPAHYARCVRTARCDDGDDRHGEALACQ